MKTQTRSRLSPKARALQNEIPHAFREPRRQNPYRSKDKEAGSPFCRDCGAILHKGKWVASQPIDAPMRLPLSLRPASVRATLRSSAEKLGQVTAFRSQTLCPACKQLADRYALGVIELHGDSWKLQEKEVLNMIRNSEKIARARNDQERILWRQTRGDTTKIYVTLPELARHIGRSLQKTFKGKTEYRRSSEEPFLRVVWHSPEKRATR
jgi:NMD protein affecting ribosome stability and mRNA decay